MGVRPSRETFSDDASDNMRWLIDALRTVDMPADGFAFRAPDGTFHGKSRARWSRASAGPPTCS